MAYREADLVRCDGCGKVVERRSASVDARGASLCAHCVRCAACEKLTAREDSKPVSFGSGALCADCVARRRSLSEAEERHAQRPRPEPKSEGPTASTWIVVAIAVAFAAAVAAIQIFVPP